MAWGVHSGRSSLSSPRKPTVVAASVDRDSPPSSQSIERGIGTSRAAAKAVVDVDSLTGVHAGVTDTDSQGKQPTSTSLAPPPSVASTARRGSRSGDASALLAAAAVNVTVSAEETVAAAAAVARGWFSVPSAPACDITTDSDAASEGRGRRYRRPDIPGDLTTQSVEGRGDHDTSGEQWDDLATPSPPASGARRNGRMTVDEGEPPSQVTPDQPPLAQQHPLIRLFEAARAASLNSEAAAVSPRSPMQQPAQEKHAAGDAGVVSAGMGARGGAPPEAREGTAAFACEREAVESHKGAFDAMPTNSQTEYRSPHPPTVTQHADTSPAHHLPTPDEGNQHLQAHFSDAPFDSSGHLPLAATIEPLDRSAATVPSGAAVSRRYWGHPELGSAVYAGLAPAAATGAIAGRTTIRSPALPSRRQGTVSALDGMLATRSSSTRSLMSSGTRVRDPASRESRAGGHAATAGGAFPRPPPARPASSAGMSARPRRTPVTSAAAPQQPPAWGLDSFGPQTGLASELPVTTLYPWMNANAAMGSSGLGLPHGAGSGGKRSVSSGSRLAAPASVAPFVGGTREEYATRGLLTSPLPLAAAELSSWMLCEHALELLSL